MSAAHPMHPDVRRETELAPAGAEALNLFDFYKREKVPSRYVPGHSALIAVFTCPFCAERQGPPAYDKTIACPGCGLRMRTTGTELVVWRDAPLAQAKE